MINGGWVAAAQGFGAVTGIAMALIAAMRWGWRRLLTSVLDEVRHTRSEITGNGGQSGSIGDRMVRVERDVREIRQILRGMEIRRTAR
jgi:hypothetical protein